MRKSAAMSESSMQSTTDSAENLTGKDSSDTDSKIYSAETQNAMDLNDGGLHQSEACDSTLESEIDALSKMIDTKDISNLKIEFDDLKEQSDDINWTANFDYEISEDKKSISSLSEQTLFGICDNDTKNLEIGEPCTSRNSEIETCTVMSNDATDFVKDIPSIITGSSQVINKVHNLETDVSLYDAALDYDNKTIIQESVMKGFKNIDEKSKEESVTKGENLERSIKQEEGNLVDPLIEKIQEKENSEKISTSVNEKTGTFVDSDIKIACSVMEDTQDSASKIENKASIPEENLLESSETEEDNDIVKQTSVVDCDSAETEQVVDKTEKTSDVDSESIQIFDKTETFDERSEITDIEQVPGNTEEILGHKIDVVQKIKETSVLNIESQGTEEILDEMEGTSILENDSMDTDQVVDKRKEMTILIDESTESTEFISKTERILFVNTESKGTGQNCDKMEEMTIVQNESMDTEQTCDKTEEMSDIETENMHIEQVCNKTEVIPAVDTECINAEVCNKAEEMPISESENMDTEEVCDKIEETPILEKENVDVEQVHDTTEETMVQKCENVNVERVLDKTEETLSWKDENMDVAQVSDKTEEICIQKIENMDIEQIHDKTEEICVEKIENPAIDQVPDETEKLPISKIKNVPDELEEILDETEITSVIKHEEQSTNLLVEEPEKEIDKSEEEDYCSAAEEIEEITEKQMPYTISEEETEHTSLTREVETAQETSEEMSIPTESLTQEVETEQKQSEATCEEKNVETLEKLSISIMKEAEGKCVVEVENEDEPLSDVRAETLSPDYNDKEYCSAEEPEEFTENLGIEEYKKVEEEEPVEIKNDEDQSVKRNEETDLINKDNENELSEFQAKSMINEVRQSEKIEDEIFHANKETEIAEVESSINKGTVETLDKAEEIYEKMDEDIPLNDKVQTSLNLVHNEQVTQVQNKVTENPVDNIPDDTSGIAVNEINMSDHEDQLKVVDTKSDKSHLTTDTNNENEPMEQLEDTTFEIPIIDKSMEVLELSDSRVSEIPRDITGKNTDDINATKELKMIKEQSNVCMEDFVDNSESTNIPMLNLNKNSKVSEGEKLVEEEKVVEESERDDNEKCLDQVVESVTTLEEKDINEPLCQNDDSLKNITAPIVDTKQCEQTSEIKDVENKDDVNEASVLDKPAIVIFTDDSEDHPTSEDITSKSEDESLKQKEYDDFTAKLQDTMDVEKDQNDPLADVDNLEDDPLYKEAKSILEVHNESDEESEEQVEINLSLDPSDSNSPCNKDLFEKAVVAEEFEDAMKEVMQPSCETAESESNVGQVTGEMVNPLQQTLDIDLLPENHESNLQVDKSESNKETQFVDRDDDMPLILKDSDSKDSSRYQDACEYSNIADKTETNEIETDNKSVEDSSPSSKPVSNFAGLILKEKDEYHFEKLTEETEEVMQMEESDNDKTNIIPKTPEISELESAVKFLQESEEHTEESSTEISQKMVNIMVENLVAEEKRRTLFISTKSSTINEVAAFDVDMAEITSDPIAISEAEIISEAAKLESERKAKISKEIEESRQTTKSSGILETTDIDIQSVTSDLLQVVKEPSKVVPAVIKISLPINLEKSEIMPKASILEERLKEPPKIEIPESTKMCDISTTSKTNLLIPQDAKISPFPKALESPKESEKIDSKFLDTQKKEVDKSENENIGSPRIILKIAKSAIADCAEPRSPKSPKIRSATNSPNPDDTAGHKLGKIKLKLSKSGHPSIISNDTIEDSLQWHTDSTCSLSPVGVKIKLSKSGETASISEKHEALEEKEKRDQSPLGMKIKLSKSGDASIVQQEPAKETNTSKHKDKLEILQEIPKRTESPIGMKIKLSKSGDASIVPVDKTPSSEDTGTSSDDIQDSKRLEPHIGMKVKLSKSGDASIVLCDQIEETKDTLESKEKVADNSSIPVKIKLAKSKGGNASIIPSDSIDQVKDKLDFSDSPKRTESPLGIKFKLSKTGDASIIHSEVSSDEVSDISKLKEQDSLKIKVSKVTSETGALSTSEAMTDESLKRIEAGIGIKITRWKSGDAAVVPETTKKSVESPIGMKIKFSKTGDPSIVHSDTSKETLKSKEEDNQKINEPAVKIKHSKIREQSIHNEPEKKDKSIRSKESESPLEMKIKLSKTGHPTIVTPLDVTNESLLHSNKHKEIAKKSHMEAVFESIHTRDTASKRKDITIAPIEQKKSKLETKLTQMLPDVTIQPIAPKEQQPQLMLEQKGSSISRQQVNVINREISITHVRSLSNPTDVAVGDRLKNILLKSTPASSSPSSSDCEIIEHRPELIIVNENSNSSQDVMIIDEVPPKVSATKVPKKRGRPRRSEKIIQEPQVLQSTLINQAQDPLACEQPQMVAILPPKENERPRRTCRSQKSYAPPKRGRGGRGRGKRKLEDVNQVPSKKFKIDQDLTAIEQLTTSLISVQTSPIKPVKFRKSSELYKALKQSPLDRKNKQTEVEIIEMPICKISETISLNESAIAMDTTPSLSEVQPVVVPVVLDSPENQIVKEAIKDIITILPSGESESKQSSPEKNNQMEIKDTPKYDEKTCDKVSMTLTQEPSNWLTPPSKKLSEPSVRSENISTVTVIDEETRMSSECGSRSQTPARNMTAPVPETLVNEESQGSVLSTATTESEKVKVKNRRMEINFDPDEGPFTVDKIAEYEWPPDKKGETFMIQEQISQYLGVKSFKRKYPDLKRRMVDMEERNHLRENGLVSEGMCDMGLTAVCSSEVLDVMCSDFPDQYEEYRKHMRDKQIKEHSKKQKELTAAATAEKNRIDLAEMAMQSVLSWNANLNKARRDNRKCSLDLQSFTIHMPKKQQKVETDRSISHYPVALIPGQYTDYYREYTPAELRYYPLNTVLYGPMKPNERKFDSQSEGSQSDSDSDSSSDDSSSSSSEGTQDTEESQSTMDDVDMEIVAQKEENKNIKCKICLKNLNKGNRPEVLIQCGTCSGSVHPSCIDLTVDMVPHIRGYAWQCTDCKTCAQCHDPADEDKMLFCDMCDRGYHIYCVGLRRVPQGRWHCQECAVCANCGSKEPGGANSDRNSVAQWQHEYKKGDKNTRVYVSTLCVPCSKLWRKGRYCPHCSRCHVTSRLDLDQNLVHCSACDKYLHLDCVETKGLTIDRKNYQCDFCSPVRQHFTKPLISKSFRT